jgi:hypothetical protein
MEIKRHSPDISTGDIPIGDSCRTETFHNLLDNKTSEFKRTIMDEI